MDLVNKQNPRTYSTKELSANRHRSRDTSMIAVRWYDAMVGEEGRFGWPQLAMESLTFSNLPHRPISKFNIAWLFGVIPALGLRWLPGSMCVARANSIVGERPRVEGVCAGEGSASLGVKQ